MKESGTLNTLERYAQEMLPLLAFLPQYPEYHDWAKISEKITSARENGDFLKLHDQYPFLTDMFFHLIVAGQDAETRYLESLWEKMVLSVDVPEKELLHSLLGILKAENVSQQTFFEAQLHNAVTGPASTGKRTVSECAEEEFIRNLNSMTECGNADPEKIKKSVILAKFQLKFIPRAKRKEYVCSYIEQLKRIREKLDPAENKCIRIVNYFIEKYQNIPMNFLNEEEYVSAGSVPQDSNPDEKAYCKLTADMGAIHQKYENFIRTLMEKLASGEGGSSSVIRQTCRKWENVIRFGQTAGIAGSEKIHPEYIRHGMDAQVLLHKICASRAYHVGRFGSGKIAPKSLDGRYDRSGQYIDADFLLDTVGMDAFTHILNTRMREYLDGKHTDSYLISLIDNVCSAKIDHATGNDLEYKPAGVNLSLDEPVESTSGDGKTQTIGDRIPAPEPGREETDVQAYVLRKIKNHSVLLYLYFILLWKGITTETLKILKASGISVPLDKLKFDGELSKGEILEILGKGGNGHFLSRALQQLLKEPDIQNDPELEDFRKAAKVFCKAK